MRIKQIIKVILLKNKKRKMKKKADFSEDLTISRYTLIQNNGNTQNVRIGKHCTIFGIIQALYGGNIEIGENVFVGSDSMIQSSNSIIIGNNVIISSNVTICDNNNHPVDPISRMKMSQCSDYLHDELWTWKYAKSSPIIIEDNTWIGKNSAILKGVTVGKGAVVALGAVVTKDVPPYTIVAGNPAKVVRSLSYEDNKGENKE